jgi:precorrin-6A/cobalt-precorrin-6A reductase
VSGTDADDEQFAHGQSLAHGSFTLGPVRILVLGGTGEARALAADLVADGRDVLSSLAGRVQQPRLPEGPVRIGGFGGVDGLVEFLRTQEITALVDATHPFAQTITTNAAAAATRAGVPRLVLRRPGWDVDPSWTVVADMTAAAAAVRDWDGGTVFVTTGRRDLAVFAGDERHRFVVRTVDPPDWPVPPHATVLLDRGPYTIEGERALLREHAVGLLVTKDSGGPMTMAKLQAAREADVQVVMVQRPTLPEPSQVVSTVAAAIAWIDQLG